MKNVCVFLFRRDLRVFDNTAFYHALEYCVAHPGTVLWPVFVFHETQVSTELNEYYSERCFRFLLRSLHNLCHAYLRGSLDFVYCKSNENELDVLKRHVKDIKAVFYNKDLTPFAKQRDQRLSQQTGVYVGAYEDYTIYPMGTVLNKSGKPYLVFTPFYNAILKNYSVPKPFVTERRIRSLLRKTTLIRPAGQVGLLHLSNKASTLFTRDTNVTRDFVMRTVLRSTRFKDYARLRDRMDLLEGATTRIGPYLKFGLVSTREALRAFVSSYGPTHELVKQLYWREFYYITHDAFPRMLRGQIHKDQKNADYNPKIFRTKTWNESETDFQKWATGNTGCPLVDAAMRQLNTTGYMHNRGRMVVASYLVKNMGIDWRKGERYFATRLIDYDPCQNNSGWQWSSGSGVSPNPYYRKFNPVIQADKYDPTGAYRKKFLN